jgi:hypothetical protein
MAERRSLAERYDKLEARHSQMVDAGAQPTTMHVQLVKVLGDLLELCQQFSTKQTPAPLRALLRMVHKLEPELVKEMAHVPPQAIREFLLDLVRRLLSIVEVPIEELTNHADAVPPITAPAPAGEDQPPP